MAATICYINKTPDTNALFTKLDTKQKGYIDEADLKKAAGTDSTAASKSAEVFKQIDSDGNGKVTKSELSAAVEKVGDQLNAQLDRSRTKTSATEVKSGGAAPAHGGGGGAPPAKSGGSDSATTTKYVAAADTNTDGTVSADEAAAYKKLQANAEAKAQAQVRAYTNNSGTSETPTSGSVDVSA